MKIDTVLLSTAYFPPIEYFAAIANAGVVLLERCETFQKQSYRTRCNIYGANGLLSLRVPVKRDPTHKTGIESVEIDYKTPWILQHKRAMEAAYMTTPFFEYYMDDIYALLDRKESSLFSLNLSIIELFSNLAGITCNISLTEEYYKGERLKDMGITDLRERIHPKYKGMSLLQELKIEKPYYQVFSDKQGFIPNLSMLDLLCNEGPNAISYLKAYSD